MHYLTKKIQALEADERRKIEAEIVGLATTAQETSADKYIVSSMLDHVDEARDRLKHFGQMQGLSSGYPSIDALTKGFVGGELIIVAGKTSYGKTTICMNIASRVALQGKRVLFVTLEMTHAELTSRYMFINGGETDNFLTVAANTVFQENDELNWQDIDGLIANAKRQLDVDLVVIDHLHYFTRELDNVAEDLGRITKELKKNAGRHNIPVILISHVRKTMQNAAATMDDLRGSSYMAQDADIVLMVGRNPDDDSEMIVRIEKNRNRGFEHGNNKDLAELLFDRTKVSEKVEAMWNTSARY